MPAGRPSTFNAELAAQACEVIALSKSGARKALDEVEGMPNYVTLLGWADQNIELANLLAHARSIRLKAWREDVLDISDDDSLDPNDRRIRIETRKWLLSKEMARIYGDKLDVTSDGQALAAPSHQIDARVQSIVMQAQARQRAAIGDVPEEAQRLLE